MHILLQLCRFQDLPGIISVLTSITSECEVARPVNGQMPAGYHEMNFSSADLASGVYFYRMIIVDNSVSSAVKPGKFQKMIIIK
jgi:hypothetical protein